MAYNPALDGIRGLSVLAVVLFHCRVPWAVGGSAGVDVFFVLSGYLITSLLIQEERAGGISVFRFYIQRAMRLYPSLLLMVGSYFLLAPFLWPLENRWLSTLLGVTYFWDYALAFWTLPFTLGHTWSLGVEEKFYLLWPLLLPSLLRLRRPVAWLLIAFVFLTGWRYFVVHAWGWQQGYFRFDTRMSGIVLGTVAALSGLRVGSTTSFLALGALAFVVMVPFMPALPGHLPVQATTLTITLTEVCALAIVCRAAALPSHRLLSYQPLASLGRLSYGVYLWHFPLVLLLRDRLPLWVTAIATLAFSVGMAAMCTHWVDGPIRKFRTRRWPSQDRLARADS